MTDQNKIQALARQLWIEAAQANAKRRQSLEYQLTMAIKSAEGFEIESDRAAIKFHLRKVYMLHAAVADYLEAMEDGMIGDDFANMDEEDVQQAVAEYVEDFFHDELETFEDAASIAAAAIRWAGK